MLPTARAVPAGGSPGVTDDLHQGRVQLGLCQRLPLQQEAHALGLHAGHRVVVVAEERDAHHGDAVVHGLEDAVEAAVAEEGPGMGVPCGTEAERAPTLRHARRAETSGNLCGAHTPITVTLSVPLCTATTATWSRDSGCLWPWEAPRAHMVATDAFLSSNSIWKHV